jgi:hypothetical protein
MVALTPLASTVSPKAITILRRAEAIKGRQGGGEPNA